MPRAELESGAAPELQAGFRPAPYVELTQEERQRHLFDQQFKNQADSAEMLSELAARGLDRKPGMPDYVFVQQLASSLPDFIKYDAGKDNVVNAGKPPSHAFKSGVGQCSTFSIVLVTACRANDIPARVVYNQPQASMPGKMFHPSMKHVCAEVWIQGTG